MELKSEKLLEYFKKLNGLSYFLNDNQLMTLCCFCEQDRYFKNRTHGHMGIEIDTFIFHCFRCDKSGILPVLLKQLNEKPEDYIDNIVSLNSWKNIRTKSYGKFDYEVNKNIIYNDSKNEKYSYKLNYLKARIGEDYDLTSINGMILDVETFISENNINFENKKLLEYLNKNFIGFLCNRNTELILRNTDESNKKFRYYNIKFNKKLYFKDFYGIKNLDMYDTGCNNIILCEGIFDLFCFNTNSELNEAYKSSLISVAGLSNNFNLLMLSVLDYCRIPKCNCVILSDNDIDDSKYYKLINETPYINELVIYRNKTGKDFGEINNINPYKKIIKKYNWKHYDNRKH